jgi:hypothetical protein
MGKVSAKSPADAIRQGKRIAAEKGQKFTSWSAVKDDGFQAINPRRKASNLFGLRKRVHKVKVGRTTGYVEARTKRGARRKASKAYGMFEPVPRRRKRGRRCNSAAPAAVALLHQQFLGRPSTQSRAVEASAAAPAHVAQLGILVELKAKAETFRFEESEKMLLCAGANGKLYIVGPVAIEAGAHFGELITVNYVAKKSHIEAGKVIEYVHDFGEEGGRRPTLGTDKDGSFIITGGSYRITPDGIAD